MLGGYCMTGILQRYPQSRATRDSTTTVELRNSQAEGASCDAVSKSETKDFVQVNEIKMFII